MAGKKGKLTARQCETLADAKYSDGDRLRLSVRGDSRSLAGAVHDQRQAARNGLGQTQQDVAQAGPHTALRANNQVADGIDPLEAKAAQEVAEKKAAQNPAFPNLRITPALKQAALADRLVAGADEEAAEQRDLRAGATA